MTADRLRFVSFEPNDGGFAAFLSMEEVLSDDQDPKVVLDRAVKIYGKSVQKMRHIIAETENFKASRKRVPARKMWQLGDVIFRLVEDLKKHSLQLDGAYRHLGRDLKVKRMWLEKVIIFRRYLPQQGAIPESRNWGQCRDNPRRIAERLRRGLPPHEGS